MKDQFPDLVLDDILRVRLQWRATRSDGAVAALRVDVTFGGLFCVRLRTPDQYLERMVRRSPDMVIGTLFAHLKRAGYTVRPIDTEALTVQMAGRSSLIAADGAESQASRPRSALRTAGPGQHAVGNRSASPNRDGRGLKPSQREVRQPRPSVPSQSIQDGRAHRGCSRGAGQSPDSPLTMPPAGAIR